MGQDEALGIPRSRLLELDVSVVVVGDAEVPEFCEIGRSTSPGTTPFSRALGLTS
jgi:hypothetical protein